MIPPSSTPPIGGVIGQASKTTYILLNINQFQEHPPQSFEEYQRITRYLNTRSNAFICTEVPADPSILTAINTDPNIQRIHDNALQYFKLFRGGLGHRVPTMGHGIQQH